MDSEQALLLSHSANGESPKKIPIVKWVMKLIMCLFFFLWISITVLFPLESAEEWTRSFTKAASASFLGFTGGAVLLLSGPLIVISMLSVLYLLLYSDENHLQLESRKGKKAKYGLGTMPVVVGGPFGVVSASELIGMGLFCAFVLWASGIYVFQKLTALFLDTHYTTTEKWSWVFQISGLGCGLAGLSCSSFMFMGVTRGSPLLRLLNISHQHGVRYHIWVANLCMCLFTFHGFLYTIGCFMSGQPLSQIISWNPTDGANLAGIICIFLGWTIWITSLPFVRRKNYELFYYTHHLYILFIIFLAMHVGNLLFCVVAGSIFLFMIDRFLRFCQSQKNVDVISITSFPCGVVQLVMPIPPSLKIGALSTIFLRVKELSWLQYHPFSVSNIPMSGKNHLSVLIKDSGNWTSQLQQNAFNSEVAKDLHTNLTASLVGPHESPFSYYLMYEHLVLVAGGIGIAPFIAVLSDVIHRISTGKSCLPRNVLLIWAMKTTNELSIQSAIDMESVRSIPFGDLQLQILIYVTQHSQPLYENDAINHLVVKSSVGFATSGNAISTLSYRGNERWFATYLMLSSVGVIAITSIVNVLYVTPYDIVNWWLQALLLIACMVASVSLFGGAIIRLWHNSEKDDCREQIVDDDERSACEENDSFLEYFASSTVIHYASRPNFKEIFESISKQWGNVGVGVLVCGPQSLEKSVAKECRSFNFKRESQEPIFHFNNNSFSW